MAIAIGLVLGTAGSSDPGTRRFIRAIADDPRFELVLLAAAQDPPCPLQGAVGWVLRQEARAFPAPAEALPELPDMPVPVPLPAALPAGCDVVVDFSHGEAALGLADAAREGLWRLGAHAPGAGFAEARDRAPVTRVTLWRHRGSGAPEAIASAAYDTKFLATRNAAVIREKSVQLVLQALARLAVTGRAEGEVEPGPQPQPQPRPFRRRDLPGYLLRTARVLATRGVNSAAERIGLRPGMFELRLGHGDGVGFDPASAVALSPPRGSYWADPFLLEHDGALFLFYEVYDYETRLGHLEVGRVVGDTMEPLGIALKRPYHLSFPFVFHSGGDVYMIPETHAARRLEVWRAVDFPLGWERVTTAFEGVNMADTVVFERDGQWWLFTNICNDSFNDHGAELHLFRIDGPELGAIEPHPLNPVVIDTLTARGGGRVFEKGGRLYRASQENSHGVYGFGLNVMEITRLDETGYEERRVRHITGAFAENVVACHHIDAAAGRFVIDARRPFLGAPKTRR